MNWKASIIACASCLLLMIPQNIFSCADVDDSYDSFNAFFNKYAAGTPAYEPFYFSDTWRLTDDEEQPLTSETLVQEWVNFTNGKVSQKDANAFVMKFGRNDLSNLYYYIESNKPLSIPDSVKSNQMTKFFLESKNLEALGYLMYAKQVEPYVTAMYNSWDATPRDSLKMNGLMKNGLQLYNATTSPTFQLKYGYQVVRLAHYNHQYENAIKYYDELVAKNATPSVLQSMSLGLKAGALYRLGREPEAAYIFSEVFNETDIKKIANFNSFVWSVPRDGNFQRDYLSLCKNDKERANMLALYSLSNNEIDISALTEIHKLSPGKSVMPALVVREINKIELNYLPGFYIDAPYKDEPDKKIDKNVNEKEALNELVTLLNQMIESKKYEQNGLFNIGAAYVSYLLKDYKKANSFLAGAKKTKLSSRLEDQWMLTNLLIAIGESPKIDAKLEQNILPSLQWLRSKARQPGEYRENTTAEEMQWDAFFDNIMVRVMADRYKKEGDTSKMVLAYGFADGAGAEYSRAVMQVRDDFDAKQAMKLYAFLSKKDFTPFESFLVKSNALDLKNVSDCLGTIYLREYNYDKAIEWLSKQTQKTIEKDPFKELLYDREERMDGDKVTITKLAYAKEMKTLLARTNDPKALYKLALGFYNITYYGYAWELATYFRSGADGYYIPEKATAFERDYYGCFKAQEYFEKALKASSDPEFKAKCMFMIAKCSQKQVRKPQWGDPGYEGDNYQKMNAAYYTAFKANKYFATYRKELSGTKFYKEALTRCSYLSDFVSTKK